MATNVQAIFAKRLGVLYQAATKLASLLRRGVPEEAAQLTVREELMRTLPPTEVEWASVLRSARRFSEDGKPL